MAKTYGQFCSVARSLDVVGDRWALLVVRELLLGPCRFTDLQGALPGIGTNVLSTRLRELEAAGVVEQRRVPAPTPAVLYALTDAGRGLREVIGALGRWGLDRLETPGDGDIVEPRWFAQSLAASIDARSAGIGDGTVIELRIDDDNLTLTVEDGRLVVHRGPAAAAGSADVRLIGKLRDFFATAKGKPEAADRITAEGDPTLARRFLAHLHDAFVPNHGA
jgi:DNA-binding HxlR family transcriptional regulator